MNLRSDVAKKIERDLEVFGLSDCAKDIAIFIANQPYPTDFYLSLTDLVKAVNACPKEDVEKVVNYLSSPPNPVLSRSYCFVDSERIFHELDEEALLGFQETKKLYHPSSGKIVDESDLQIFLLYKTSVEKVADL